MRPEDIVKDRVSGSSEICAHTCALLSKIPVEKGKGMAERILNAHRPMALLHACVNRYLSGEDIADFMEEYHKRLETAAGLALQFIEEKESVLTISSSSAVEITLSGFGGNIYVMESRPMLEGIVMAKRLSEKGIDISVVTDAYGISMVAKGKVDAVLIGADGIYRNALINKVGTYALSVAAENSDTDFVAVITTDKIFPKDVVLSEEEIMQFHEPKEISKNINAENPYFEETPMWERMKVFTEKGLWKIRSP